MSLRQKRKKTQNTQEIEITPKFKKNTPKKITTIRNNITKLKKTIKKHCYVIFKCYLMFLKNLMVSIFVCFLNIFNIFLIIKSCV